MQYALTGLDTHPDYGFGITGEAYYHSAEYLYNNLGKIETFQQVEMPMNFLFRHSIELFLKSLIIIFHNKLEIPYGTESYNSVNPKILTNGKWKDLFSCHWVDELYIYWRDELLLQNLTELKAIAPQGDWQEEKSISELFPLIAKYDRDSSFFRYPMTKNSALDFQKYSMQRINSEKIKLIFDGKVEKKRKKGAKVIMLLHNEKKEIIDGFERADDVLDEVTQALKHVSHYFMCIHIMTRVTLCKGS